MLEGIIGIILSKPILYRNNLNRARRLNDLCLGSLCICALAESPLPSLIPCKLDRWRLTLYRFHDKNHTFQGVDPKLLVFLHSFIFLLGRLCCSLLLHRQDNHLSSLSLYRGKRHTSSFQQSDFSPSFLHYWNRCNSLLCI